MDELKGNFSVVFICENCNTSAIPPTHCGRAMKIVDLDGVKNWVCWKGQHQPCCGKEAFFEYDVCCENPNPVSNIQELIN